MREEGPRSACRHGRQRADSFYTHVEVCSELQAHGGDCGEKKKKRKGKTSLFFCRLMEGNVVKKKKKERENQLFLLISPLLKFSPLT